MTADEAKREVNKAFEPAFANYIIEALTNGATCSDKRESSTDAVSREDVKNFIESFIHEIITESGTDKNAHTNEVLREVARGVGDIPPVTLEKTTITYKDCAEAMLKMWIDNVLTDGQYNKIMDKLNTKHIEDMRGGKE